MGEFDVFRLSAMAPSPTVRPSKWRSRSPSRRISNRRMLASSPVSSTPPRISAPGLQAPAKPHPASRRRAGRRRSDRPSHFLSAVAGKLDRRDLHRHSGQHAAARSPGHGPGRYRIRRNRAARCHLGACMAALRLAVRTRWRHLAAMPASPGPSQAHGARDRPARAGDWRRRRVRARARLTGRGAPIAGRRPSPCPPKHPAKPNSKSPLAPCPSAMRRRSC